MARISIEDQRDTNCTNSHEESQERRLVTRRAAHSGSEILTTEALRTRRVELFREEGMLKNERTRRIFNDLKGTLEIRNAGLCQKSFGAPSAAQAWCPPANYSKETAEEAAEQELHSKNFFRLNITTKDTKIPQIKTHKLHELSRTDEFNKFLQRMRAK
jgi:hypothetical protein